MEYRLLGPFEIREGERLLALPVGKPRTLLCVLALNAGDVVPTESLVDALWGERPPATAQNALQGYVSQLRRVLGKGAIRTQPPGYLLVLGEGDTIDVEVAEALAEQGRADLVAGSPEQAAARLAEALALWHGTPLADFGYESFAQPEIARLEELRLSLLEERFEAELELGRHGELVGELEALAGAHPLRERLGRQLMLALYRAGRQAEALEAYRRAQHALVEELGIEPSRELRRLNRAILNQDPALASPVMPAVPETNLPFPPTPLVGRERELAELEGLLGRSDEVRLLTLTGPGGTGKTRLALEAASELHARRAYPDGVWHVGLETLSDPALVLASVAQALGATDELSAHIDGKRLLVLLDNFEHLVEAAADLGRLLSSCPSLDLLVTSRVPLHLSAEHEYPVEPLAEADAVALFHSRARAVRPDFAANGEVPKICLRLDGLPLAIELAAARVKALSPKAILERLEHGLDLLTGGARDAPERQRTLRATIEWSHTLLGEDEQKLFRRLAVFVCGFTLEAAERVCGADLDTLQSLVEKNLVRRELERFTMLETIREYGVERLEESGEADELQREYVVWFADLAERADAALRTPEQPLWLERLESEIGNLRTVLRWSLEGGEPEAGLRICTALTWFWFHHGYVAEADRWLDVAISRLDDASPLIQGPVLRAAGNAAFLTDDEEQARTLLGQALTIARESGDRRTAALALRSLAVVARSSEDLDGAVELAEQALLVSRELDDPFLTRQSLHVLADSLRDMGHHARARELFEEGIRLGRETGNLLDAAQTIHSLGDLALDTDDLDWAEELYTESLAIARQFEDDHCAAYCLAGLASAAAGRGAFERAARLWGAAQALERKLGITVMPPPERTRYERRVGEVCDAEPEALAAGRELDLGEAVELALHP